jgi:hypothetical protein
MDDLTRAQLEALVSEATPGPWVAEGVGALEKLFVVTTGADLDARLLAYIEYPVAGPAGKENCANARLIAAAPALARQLLATMDALEAEREERAEQERLLKNWVIHARCQTVPAEFATPRLRAGWLNGRHAAANEVADIILGKHHD